ncbi:hypothetical protein B1A99_32285 [Cohnella sp. CIP 111063]|uniref:nuclear transport factor 2 family protein n=1 Tax=unclassified Cohnella TaxID=2636738 RepID=UPI000B8C0F00|nr:MULTISPECIES: nuclear transport factor 2 family protein [unclassified Cohnella]OXS52874.1 hypothetical protein B1A99_32285 [Cohnella sp. CIP 111063]PRX59847.1 SnoaL-like protein [Cohnella sp. SGD-V74]
MKLDQKLNHRYKFNHIGLVTDQPRRGEIFNAGTGVWVTDPGQDRYAIEWLRFSPESAGNWGPLSSNPHICFEVDNIEAAVRGHQVLYEPFDYIAGKVRAAFVVHDGACIEFIQYLVPGIDLWEELRKQASASPQPGPFNAEELLAIVDRQDTKAYLEHYWEDASFTFANLPPAVGREAIRGLVDGIFSKVTSLSHDRLETYVVDDGRIVVSSGVVTYTRHDGVRKSYPFSGTYKLEGGKIKQYQSYIDSHDLFD